MTVNLHKSLCPWIQNLQYVTHNSSIPKNLLKAMIYSSFDFKNYRNFFVLYLIMEENYFAFTWKINCFNELVSRHPNGSFFYSERFWSPRGHSGKSDNNVQSNFDNTGYLWRFKNGVDKKSNDYISLYLEAIKHIMRNKII